MRLFTMIQAGAYYCVAAVENSSLQLIQVGMCCYEFYKDQRYGWYGLAMSTDLGQ